MMRSAILALVAAGFAVAQSANAPAFEVASIRLHQGRAPYVGFKPSGSRFDVSAVSVVGMVMFAYDLKTYQIQGGPAWAESDAWDITAKAPGPSEPSRAQFKQMLQELLADRYRLSFHHETKEITVYALVVAGKNKPKLQETAADSQSRLSLGAKLMTVTKGSMDQLANQLSHWAGIDLPVIDKTGLKGEYDYKLTWTDAEEKGATTEGDWSAILEDQLGLKLTSQKAPIEMLVIDRAEKPSEN